MARPRKLDRKSVRLSARFTEAEANEITANADKSGVTVSDLLRSGSMQVPLPRARRRPVQNADELSAVLRQVGKIGSNVNQLAHKANMGQWPGVEAIAQARADIQWMKAHVMKALGTAPDEDRQP